MEYRDGVAGATSRRCQQQLAKLIARPFSTVLIWLVVAISLSLPSSLLLTLDNLSRIVPDLAQGGHVRDVDVRGRLGDGAAS